MSEETLLSRFETAAKANPHKAAIVTGRRSVTFGELAAAVGRRAQAETDAGAGTPLLMREREPAAFMAAFFAAMRLGRPAFVCPAGQALPDDAPVQQADGHTARAGEFLWGATSGTMGEPKIFARTHRSWLESFAACESVFPFTAGDVVAVPGSLTHSLFLYAAVHALCRGLSVAMPDAYVLRRVAGLMRRARASVLYAVPAMLADFVTAAGGMLAPRIVFVGGQRLPGDIRRKAEACWPGADIVEFYGASELSFVSYASTRHPAPSGSAGRLFPGVRVEIRNENGAPLSENRSGVIHVSSPMLFSRYVQPASDRAGEDAWATAGDLGHLDADGFLYIEGRADREINMGGRKISPERIESALLDHSAVARVAVIALPDAKRGEIAAAVIQPALEHDLVPSRLRRHCRARLAAWELPRLFIEARDMPLTRSGKIALAELNRAIVAREPGFRVLR